LEGKSNCYYITANLNGKVEWENEADLKHGMSNTLSATKVILLRGSLMKELKKDISKRDARFTSSVHLRTQQNVNF
jgi:hypothetical protein